MICKIQKCLHWIWNVPLITTGNSSRVLWPGVSFHSICMKIQRRWWFSESKHRFLLGVGIYLIRSPRGRSSGQKSTIWEIYYGFGKMGLVNKAIPNSQYGWKTRYILMQVKTWHKTRSLNWQKFWHTHDEPQAFVRESRFGWSSSSWLGRSVSRRG